MRPEFACFYLHQNLRLAWVRERSGNNVALVTARSETVRQRRGNLLLRWQGEPVAGPEAALAQLQERGENLAPPAGALEMLYADMEDGKPYTLASLAGRVLPSPMDGWQQAALFVALLEDKRRFRYSGGRFTARSAEEVAERTRRAEEEAEARRWAAKAEHWRQQLERGEWAPGDDPEAPAFLEHLRSLLAKEKQSPHWQRLARPLELSQLHRIDLQARLKTWLRTAEAWPGWPAIWLRWGDVPESFPPELEAAAAALAAQPVQREGRADYRDPPAYSVDSVNTLDIDDAVSILERDRTGLVIALHIAEPSVAVLPDHPLFAEAGERMYSVYTPQAVYPMLPTAVSNDRFSLVAGADREALTLRVRLREGEAELLDVERSMVRLADNLDYDRGEALLGDQPDSWGRLNELCASLTAARAERGAIVQDRFEVWVDAADPQHVRLTELWRNRPIHRLVEELAIVHNELAGLYCERHALPGIYRAQPRPRWRRGYANEGLAGLPAARFGTEPEEHAGLGCLRYMQTTSPIRRFADLVMQRQIAAHAATGRVSFPQAEVLGAWAERAESRLATTSAVARRIEEHWKRIYLTQHPGLQMAATVRRRGEGETHRVWLEPVQLGASCTLPPGVEEGERVRVRLDTVELDQREVWVACL